MAAQTQLRKLSRKVDSLEKDLAKKQRELDTAKAKAAHAHQLGNTAMYDQYVMEAGAAARSITSISETRTQSIALRTNLENTLRGIDLQVSISQVSASMASSNIHGDKRAAAVGKLIAVADKNYTNLKDSVEISAAFIDKHVTDPETQAAVEAVRKELELKRELDELTRDDGDDDADDVEDDAVSVTTKTTSLLQKRIDAIKHG